jgi:hypothetical protein
MSNPQAHLRNHQDAQHSSLLRSRDEREQAEREQAVRAAEGVDMIAALHPQRVLGNAQLGGLSSPGAPGAGSGMEGVAAIVGRAGRQIQTKLMLGPANDSFEQEADAVADQVVQRLSARGPARTDAEGSAPQLQRQEEEEELQMKRADGLGAISVVQRQEEEEELQMQRAEPASAAGGQLVPEVESEIDAARTGGDHLPGPLRGGMEQSFGADFGGVRVHTGPQADTLNRKLNARAFTTGSDIFFRQGEYDPGSAGGQHLLAHELTHVIHQGGARQVQPKRQSSDPHADPFFRSE